MKSRLDKKPLDRKQKMLLGSIAIVLLGTSWVGISYSRETRRAFARLEGRSQVMPSPWGEIEFSQGGVGPPVLVIHGSGGGFDQGEILARAVLGDDFRWIAPSRFGYLRSTFTPNATFDEQAHAFAFLLDQLAIDQVAVVALSHGGPSALLLAALFPERVTSLTLLSCGVATQPSVDQAAANRKGKMLTTIFQNDPLSWAITKIFRSQLIELMGADAKMIASLDPERRELIDRVIDTMYPVSPRSAGVTFDNQASLPNERIAAIRAPTLILHAVDDSLQLYANALFAAEKIPGARVISFDRGGHLVLALERERVREAIRQHILEHAGKESATWN